MAQDMVAALRFARAELTALERDEHVAEWIRLAETVSRQLDAKPQVGRPEAGVRKAARDLGLSETTPAARRRLPGSRTKRRKPRGRRGVKNSDRGFLQQ